MSMNQTVLWCLSPVPAHAVLLFLRSSFVVKAKEREEMACKMGLVVLVDREAATAANVASQMTFDPKSAPSLSAFEELGS